jgi:gliding motility-associated-like protein
VAESSAEYLLIGNFFSSAETASNVLSNAGGLIAYYFIDDVRVEEVDVQLANRLGNDTTLCAGETMVLDAFVEGATYQWDDFSTEPTLTVEVGDVYWVDITLGDCIYRDSITVIYEPSIFLGKDTLLCFGESLILGTEDMMREYQWSDGSAGSTLEVNEPGVYWVTLPSENCLISDTIVVDYLDCPGMIPNVFTPGNDDANETFYIENIGNREWQLRIFNRWGKEVYFSDNYQNDWTGENLSSGVYFYYLTSPILEREYKGWVHLMREHTMLTKNK